jgi:pyruvate,water dikinase
MCAAFHPRPVIVRTSDFKTNEYARLLGGKQFEAEEENPMLGFRGASRYYDPRYAEGFALECEALRRVRDEMGLTNLKVMIPFCRTPAEGGNVLEAMAAHGLRRGEGLEVYVMCELPSNVVLAEEFLRIFDGFSIGSNDLTQLVLGIDRDSGTVSHLFDERDSAVRRMIAAAIDAGRAAGKPIGICGQAPSDYPELAGWLVERGIGSLSLNPDSLVKTKLVVAAVEKDLPAPQPPGGARKPPASRKGTSLAAKP